MGSDTAYKTAPSYRKKSTGVGQVSRASKSNDHSARLTTHKQHPKTRGEWATESSGVFSISPPRTATHIIAESRIRQHNRNTKNGSTSYVASYGPNHLSHLLRRKRRWRRKLSGHSSPRTNHSTPAGCSDLLAASAEQRLADRPS